MTSANSKKRDDLDICSEFSPTRHLWVELCPEYAVNFHWYEGKDKGFIVECLWEPKRPGPSEMGDMVQMFQEELASFCSRALEDYVC